jgi:hypothetical protein
VEPPTSGPTIEPRMCDFGETKLLNTWPRSFVYQMFATIPSDVVPNDWAVILQFEKHYSGKIIRDTDCGNVSSGDAFLFFIDFC